MKQAITVLFLQNFLYPLCLPCTGGWYNSSGYFLSLRESDRMGTLKYKTWITFSTDPSDFVPSFALWSRMGFSHFLDSGKSSSSFFFSFFLSPRLTTSAALSGMVRIEVNMSVWNEMLSISWGRSLLYVARYSRRNNIAVYTDLWSNPVWKHGHLTLKWNQMEKKMAEKKEAY